MKNKKSNAMHRTSLWLALGMALTAPIALPAFAQNTAGALAGHAAAGATVTVTNPATGFSRTVAVDADGSYRIASLPVGTYTVTVQQNGQAVGSPVTVNVSLGTTTTRDLAGASAELQTVEVQGTSISPIDVSSTESATNITADQIQRLPLQRDALSVAQLAPGVVKGEFGGVSFGGSSVAENAVYINGLNVTDFYNRVGNSAVPDAFYQEFQVKTGGYSVEFGRTTGGVINAVTRRGTNEFHAGADIVIDGLWQGNGRNYAPTLYTRWDDSDENNYSVWGSGALIKDRLFFFGIYEKRDLD
jgi:hypothetical protein